MASRWWWKQQLLWNVYFMWLYHRRLSSSYLSPWKPEISHQDLCYASTLAMDTESPKHWISTPYLHDWSPIRLNFIHCQWPWKLKHLYRHSIPIRKCATSHWLLILKVLGHSDKSLNANECNNATRLLDALRMRDKQLIIRRDWYGIHRHLFCCYSISNLEESRKSMINSHSHDSGSWTIESRFLLSLYLTV
jgi:hypothetical protein